MSALRSVSVTLGAAGIGGSGAGATSLGGGGGSGAGATSAGVTPVRTAAAAVLGTALVGIGSAERVGSVGSSSLSSALPLDIATVLPFLAAARDWRRAASALALAAASAACALA